MFGATRNAPKSHADHNQCPNLGRPWQLHWMSAGRATARVVCGQVLRTGEERPTSPSGPSRP
eukprot:11032590-Prorocentrum_lima.AAC.1